MNTINNKQDFSDLAELATKVKSETNEVNQEISTEATVEDSGGDTTNSVMEVETVPQKDNPVNVEQLNEGGKEPEDSKDYDVLQYEERVVDVIQMVIWLEENLPIFKNLYLVTGDFVDKINLGFGKLLNNLLYFEKMKEKILQQTKEFKVVFDISDDDKKSITHMIEDKMEAHKASCRDIIEEGGKRILQKELQLKQDREDFLQMLQQYKEGIREELMEMRKVNDESIKKIKFNASFLDNIHRIEKECLIAFVFSLVTITSVLTSVDIHLLQLKW